MIVSVAPGPNLESNKARRSGEPSLLVVTTSTPRSCAAPIIVCLTYSVSGNSQEA